MISINDDRLQSGSDTTAKGFVSAHYTLLVGGEAKTLRPAKARVRRESSTGEFLTAIIRSKGTNYRQNSISIRLIIDFNGLGFTAGSKNLRSYSHCKHLRTWISTLVLSKTTAWKSSENLNTLSPRYSNWIPSIAGCRKRKIAKDMNFDKVYSLFFQAKTDPHRNREESHGIDSLTNYFPSPKTSSSKNSITIENLILSNF